MKKKLNRVELDLLIVYLVSELSDKLTELNDLDMGKSGIYEEVQKPLWELFDKTIFRGF